MSDNQMPRDVGRYRLYDEIAAGGMATVHVGRLRGPAGFARTVAIKRLHPQFAHDPEFVSMFLDEARLAARIHHPNVAAILDVVALRGELFLVMEYVRGETLSRLLPACERAGITIPFRIAATIMQQALLGLHAAHEARDHRGTALNMVHRDVSPQNIMVGADGITRMLDFGVAKAATRLQTTGHGQVKGKLSYMAPEQLRLEPIDRRTDLFAAGVVLWEVLTGRRLFAADDPGAVIARILTHTAEAPSRLVPGIPPELDAVVARALKRQRTDRFASALEFARELERAVAPVGALEVSEWVCAVAGPVLEARERTVAAVEIASESTPSESLRGEETTSPPIGAYIPDPNDEVTVGVQPEVLLASLPKRKDRRLVWGLAAAALFAAILIFMLRAWPSSEPAVATTSPVTGSPEPIPPAEPPAPVASAVPPEPSAEPAAALPADSATQEVPAIAPSAPATPSRRAKRSSNASSTRSSGVSSKCNPPYEVTPQGLKRYKPECFR